MNSITPNIHTHPVNIAGYLIAFASALVNLATNQQIHGILSGLPQTQTIQIVSAVLGAIAAIATAVKFQPAAPNAST